MTNELEEKQRDIFEFRDAEQRAKGLYFFCGGCYRKRKSGCDVEILGEWSSMAVVCYSIRVKSKMIGGYETPRMMR